jgi:hypothetical protein
MKKNLKQMNLRTDYTIKPLFGKRKQSMGMPKLNYFNVIKQMSPQGVTPMG